MTRFYTKTGDDGYTSLLGEGRAPKYDRRIEALGTIDETSALIGLARTTSLAPQTLSILIKIQRDLYHIMAEVSATPENASRFRKISDDNVHWLEVQIENISHDVTIPKEFILAGDSKAGAVIDIARTIVRRAERQIARLLHLKKIENRELLHYLNRLSSLCFVLELLENQTAGSNNTTLAKE
jgi:cob(I)alamin adenosyltransferase